jgi:nicotinamidase-related amidase
MQQALIIIDVQNDYFPNGNYPLWQAEKTLHQIEGAIASAQQGRIPIILVQHIANPDNGKSPIFNLGTEGVELHPRLRAAAPLAPVVIKRHADSFIDTNLEQVLRELGVTELLICGMMTQNCVTHTAISKSAEQYQVKIVGDCCTSVDQIIHAIALKAAAVRVPVLNSSEVFA